MSNAFEKRFGLSDKVALVTGSGRGIGRAVATTLAEAGAAVAVQDLKLAEAESTAAAIRDAGGKAIALAGDAAEQKDIEASLARTRDELGRLDILVNNAGIYPFSSIPEMAIEEWDAVMRLNLRGVFLFTKLAAQLMVELGNGGRIIQLSSVQGLRPTAPGVAHYNMSKAGVIALAKAAALEFGPHGIAVNAVAPGLIATPGTQPLIDEGSLGDPKDKVPFGARWGTPEEVADVILFLAGPAASYITGETIVIDGGFLLK
jgi:2-deoxy-D-gluconate 3-dehydrogenase